ncbi:tRNA-guanine transglycosylase [Legionella lytica]|uniref:tRNA-guanine transglycosylase n=1 Tax=Legionella lytica TaxID=96232 RepID=A0ABW8D6F3_9GAMM
MLVTTQKYIPVGTSEAGLCLTAENWLEAKVNTLSFSLEFLLYKPGLTLLKKIPSLPKYLGWFGAIILNASSLKANREGTYLLKSPFDGSKTKITAMELVELIKHLNPDAVILPKKILQDSPQIWAILPESIMPFFNAEDLRHHPLTQKHGVYFTEANDSFTQWAHLPRYVMGDFNEEAIRHLRAQGIEFVETDEPVKAGFHGKVYSQQGEIDLTNKDAEMQFDIIDSSCICPVCKQQFTKAYFHHLIEHTPLLCQRFLIQHNVFWMA